MLFLMLKNLIGRLKGPKARIYLDHAAATPVREEVLTAMAPYFRDRFGNPSAIHEEGRTAREALERARTDIARVLHVRPENIIFTASGTESNNLALFGLLHRLVGDGAHAYEDIEIISTQIEHPSVLRVLEYIEKQGVTIRYARLSDEGVIDEAHFRSLLSEKTALVTCAYANSEIGVVQPVKRLTRAVRKFNAEHDRTVKVHLDASQAPLWMSCDMDMLGVDMMTLDAGKCCGPKGVGVLCVRETSTIKGVTLGGEQEYGLRGGTENTPLIVGCAVAIERAQAHWEERSKRVKQLRDDMTERLLRDIDGSVLNGPREERIANNVNISIPDIDSEYAVVSLDVKGIAASTQSACGGARGAGSPVVRALTGDEARANATIRFTLGEETSEAELAEAALCLKEHVEKMRRSKVQ